MLDLTQLPDYYMGKYGRDRVAEITGKTPSLVAMLHRTKKFPLDAVSKLLEFDPEPLKGIQPLYPPVVRGNKFMVLVPLAGPPQPKMMDSLIKLFNPAEMDYRRIAFNCPSVQRNALAAEFLRSPCEWAGWLDGDSLVPCGDAAWFKEAAELPQMPDAYAGLHAFNRMFFHKKTLISGCYVGRKKGGAPQFGNGSTPEMRALVKRGPVNKIIEVPWCGFGCVLTHRSVFTDIIKVMGPEIKMRPDSAIAKRFNYEYGFFDPADRETPGDDIPFCQRAARAGHKCYVDLAVHAAHVGDRPFTYADL